MDEEARASGGASSGARDAMGLPTHDGVGHRVKRTASLRRLAIWGAAVAVLTLALYLPTLTGGAPWSWYIGEAPPLATLLLGFVAGLFSAHWWWPRTKRWVPLERFCAVLVAEWEDERPPVDGDMEQLRAMVRPHVLERARRTMIRPHTVELPRRGR